MGKKEKKKFMINKDNTIKAIFKNDLDEFLEKNNMLDDFNNGKIRCCYCNNVVTKENLYSLIPVDDCLKMCCNNAKCCSLFSESELIK